MQFRTIKKFLVLTLVVVSAFSNLTPLLFKIEDAHAATALTAYLTSTAATTVTTSNTLVTTAPASETSKTNKTAKATGWGELRAQGNGTAWAAAASEPAPSGYGSLLDATTLEGQQILSGNWTPTVKLITTSGTVTAVIHARAYKRSSAGVYTLIADIASASTGITTTATAITLPATAVALTNFNTGDKLYIDYVLQITANSSSSTTATTSLYENGGANEQMLTPGYQAQPATTIADGTNPGNASLAPGGAATMADAFTFATNIGTDSITAVTVSFAAGTSAGVGLVEITNDAGTTVYGNATNPTDTQAITLGTALPVSTTATQFKIRITPKSATAMPAPPGASYAVTAIISAWTGTNATQAGTDTASATITIDNFSPNGATSVSGTAGTNANTINWTTSNSADFNTTSGSVVYRWASATAGTEVPTEGTTATAGGVNGTATTACVISSAVSTALSKIDGTGGSAGCTTTALTSGQAYTYKVFQEDTNGNYDVGVLIGTFTPAAAITVTSYTNTTETALNYAATCAGCGARIGGGAGFRQTITITGSGFGALTCGTGNCSSATNNIKIGTHQIADANVTSWTATSITFLTDSAVTGDTDTDWGANFGGASALVVTAAGGAATGLNFYVFPQITSVTQPAGFAPNTAREYASTDTDGVITLNGTRFGSPQGTGSVTVVGQPATVTSWATTTITVQVPPAILASTNTGSISMVQGTGGGGLTHTYINTLRILPRITGFTPTSAGAGATVTVNGNHFCQGASCPTAFGTTDNIIVFTSNATSTSFGGWSATSATTTVPTAAVTGNVVLTSSTYTSNGLSFTVLSSTPSDPTNLNQYTNTGLTNAISIGGVASSTPIYLSMTMQVGVSGGTLYPQVEYKATGTAFVCTGTAVCTSDAVTGTGVAGTGPSTGTVAITPTDNTYHWQARVKYTVSGTDYYSNWVSFGGNGELATDFQLDTTAPVISSISAGTPGTNSATITWTTNEISTSQVQYNTTGTFGACGSDCTTLDATYGTSHNVALTNLSSGTLYYFRVRSKDAVGNEAISTPNSSFTTTTVTQPTKITRFHIVGATSTVSNSAPLQQPFAVVMPELATSTKSIFIVIKGIYTSGATLQNIAVQVNAEPSRTYVLPVSSTSYFKILHSVSAIFISPGTNTLTITPQANTSVQITSADIVVQYAYTP